MITRLESAGKARTARGGRQSNPGQLGLFEADDLRPDDNQPAAGPAPREAAPTETERRVADGANAQARPARADAPAPTAPSPGEVRTITVADLPRYPEDLVAAVMQSLDDIPTDRTWFTYRNIQDYFGVSRATVCRRLKEGLVPRVRMQDGRVLEEGAVRRLDRTQVLWLLLAVRQPRPRV